MANKPSHNLLEDGVDACAEYIIRALNKKSVPFNVTVDRDGWIRVRTLIDYRFGEVKERPDSEFVCTYRKANACVEYIREDLAWKLEQMTQKAA